MYYIIVIIGCIVLILSIAVLQFAPLGKKIRYLVRFFLEGKNKGFTLSSLLLLYRTCAQTGVEDKASVFMSVPVLDECIQLIAKQLAEYSDKQFKDKWQLFLNDLYAYRTRLELELVQKRRSITSTNEIRQGQVCIITASHEVTVYGKVLLNTKDSITAELFNVPAVGKIRWQGRQVSIYFWRNGDSGYVFWSEVMDSRFESGRLRLRIKHSDKIVRTQKRKSVRAECRFDAALFLLYADEPYSSVYQKAGGVICTVNDISEDGALFTVKGKAANGVKMKLQFKIKNVPIVMCGKIVRFTYSAASNTSKVNFKCEFLEQDMKNAILSYVYNISPKETEEFTSTLL